MANLDPPTTISIKSTPKCTVCEKTESPMWRNRETGGEICHECYENGIENLKNEDDGEMGGGNGPSGSATQNTNGAGDEKKIRKSTRSTRFKSKAATNNNKTIPKGKSRRCIFKKNPMKSPSISVTTTTCDSLFYKDQYYQVGDIVSLMDKHNDIYYAQIRGLMTDTYCEKSAYITWLIPTQASPPPNEKFDPSTYLIGPDEELARKMSCMEFVMNAPSSYYHSKDNPFPAPDAYTKPNDVNMNMGFIWQSLGC